MYIVLSMLAFVLKTSQGMELTPLAQAVRAAIIRRGFKFNQVASELGMTQSALQNKLTKTAPLSFDSLVDLELTQRIATLIEVPYEEIIDAAKELAQRGSGAHDINVVSVLCDTLENQNATPESKKRARKAIFRMLGLEEESD